MAQNTLDDLIVSAQCLQVRSDRSPEPVPAVPRQLDCLDRGTNHVLSQLVHGHRTPAAGLKNHSRLRIMHGTELRLALVFGRFTNDFQIDRLTGSPLFPCRCSSAIRVLEARLRANQQTPLSRRLLSEEAAGHPRCEESSSSPKRKSLSLLALCSEAERLERGSRLECTSHCNIQASRVHRMRSP